MSHSSFVLSLMLAATLLLSCGKAPFEKTADQLFETRSADESGLAFSNDLKEDAQLNYLFYQSIYNGAGVGVSDFDKDGLEDLFFAGNQVSDRLYRNLGHLQFEDISDTAGISADKGWSTGVAIADLDGNGYPDIYVSRFLLEDQSLRQNKLYMNQGGMRFTEEAKSRGLADSGYSIQAAYLDYDSDGDLDLYLVNQPPNHAARRAVLKDSIDYSYTNRLFRNDAGQFTDVTSKAGLIDMAYGMSAICSDLNDDGWADIYLSNDFDEPDRLYINQGDGTFKDEAHSQLKHMSTFSMGADIADMNNDGLLDIFTADMVAEDNKRLKTNMSGMNPEKFNLLVASGKHHQYMFNALQLNRGEGHFSEIAQLSGISATDWSWTALFCDMDLDGHKDLYVSNGLKRDVRDNDFNIARRKRVRELQNEAAARGEKGLSVNPLELLAMSPSTEIPNYMYQNQGDLTFKNVAEDWGLATPRISQGAAYADLDNDGDMDLVTNNIDAAASLFENKRESYVDHHWLQVQLQASMIEGSQVKIITANGLQVQECLPVRGYMSSSTSILQFGLGADERIDELWITWPDGTQQVHKDLEVDQRMTFAPQELDGILPSPQKDSALFEVAALPFSHVENEFNDFETEILLPHRMSTLGPCLCQGDINGDGLADMYVGSSWERSGAIFLASVDSGFTMTEIIDGQNYEDTGCQLLDTDGDGDLDLYIVSGGNEQREDMSGYQDRLYLNDGSGHFEKTNELLPEMPTSGQCVISADYDGDGDLDLFVGGRQHPGKYPYPADSRLLINEGGRFIDATSDLAPELLGLGMVTDALWHDRDNDGDLDLTIVGEWMPIRFFEQRDGKLVSAGSVAHSTGWWNCIAAHDMDGDGDEDLILGNLGLNIKYKASPAEPFEIFSADFDENGSNDIYMAYYQDGNCFPVRGRQCSSQQMPFIKEKFPSYDAFSEASVFDVLGNDTSIALNYSAEQFASIVLYNDDGNWRMEALPVEAQFSVVNNIILHDFDDDGVDEIYLSGNQYDREVETTRSDASYGVLLKQDPVSKEYLVTQSGTYFNADDQRPVLISGHKKSLFYIEGE